MDTIVTSTWWQHQIAHQDYFLDGILPFNALSSQVVYIRVCNGQDSSIHLRANTQISRTVDGPRSYFSRCERSFTN